MKKQALRQFLTESGTSANPRDVICNSFMEVLIMGKLIQNLLKDIKKTGYPTELKASNLFEKKDWKISENEYFIDEDEKKGREIDLHAHTNIYIKEPFHIYFWSMLSVEIKKSKKPWVIFTSNKRMTDTGGYGLLNHMHNINKDFLSYKDIMKEHPSSEFIRLGRTEHVAFTKNNNPQIFSAILSSVKASIEQHRIAKEHKEAFNEESYDATFYSPVVLVDGKLFESYIDENNNIKLEESDHIVYSFNYVSPKYSNKQYLVDIVTLNGLNNYLSSRYKWLDYMINTTNKKVQKKMNCR
jgi:hypothetical protein